MTDPNASFGLLLCSVGLAPEASLHGMPELPIRRPQGPQQTSIGKSWQLLIAQPIDCSLLSNKLSKKSLASKPSVPNQFVRTSLGLLELFIYLYMYTHTTIDIPLLAIDTSNAMTMFLLLFLLFSWLLLLFLSGYCSDDSSCYDYFCHDYYYYHYS